MNYASFWVRLMAWIIDVFILGLVAWVLSYIYQLVSGTSVEVSINGISLIPALLYLVLYQQKMGQTLGKKAMGIRVVDASGKKPSLVTFFLREVVGKFISGFILGIGYLWMLWDSKKQTLHDKIASTYVVKT